MVRLILKIGKPIKNQVKGTVSVQSLLRSEIHLQKNLPWFSCGLRFRQRKGVDVNEEKD